MNFRMFSAFIAGVAVCLLGFAWLGHGQSSHIVTSSVDRIPASSATTYYAGTPSQPSPTSGEGEATPSPTLGVSRPGRTAQDLSRTFRVSEEKVRQVDSFSMKGWGEVEAATTTIQGEVVSVVDGDTIDVRIAGKVERVRYIGIDTPETVHPSKPVQCFGREASAKNKELVFGKTVTLVRDVTDRDKYGRLLRYVYVGDTMINEALVRGGYASVYTYPPDVRYDARFREVQQLAREESVGLWGDVCRSYVPPSVPVPVSAPDPHCAIKGNISASGDKIFHSPSCKSYEKTTINTDQGERWFCSEQEAIDTGWRKALNC